MKFTTKQSIYVPKGVIPVHSFDLWGTIVNQGVLGDRVVKAYGEVSYGKVDSKTIEDNINDYMAVIRGEASALKRKKQIVDTVEDPLWDAYIRGEVDVSFEGAFYQDTLDAMLGITNAGHGVSVLTTGNSPWVSKALEIYSPEVAEKLVEVYSGNKSSPQAYQDAYYDILAHGGQMISHTEDQMKGLDGLLQSELKDKVHIIYVERDNLATPQEAEFKGIDNYVNSLDIVDYVGMGTVDTGTPNQGGEHDE